jgi:hypothetical protein
MKAQHTPTPWRYEGGYIRGISQFGRDSGLATIHPTEDGKHNAELAGQGEANVAHIVHCVNTHEQLVAALREAEAYLFGNPTRRKNEWVLSDIRAALAAAKKGAE